MRRVSVCGLLIAIGTLASHSAMGKRSRLSDDDKRHVRSALMHAKSISGLRGIQSSLNEVSVDNLMENEIRSCLDEHFRHSSLITIFNLTATTVDPEETYTLRWWNPFKYAELLARENEDFANFLDVALTQHPPTLMTPWRILVAWDEMVPGNPLSDAGRKLMVSSWTFYELPKALSVATAWCTPLVLRSKIMNRIPGKFSAVLKSFLQVLLLDTVCGFQIAGMRIRVKDRVVTMFPHPYNDGSCFSFLPSSLPPLPPSSSFLLPPHSVYSSHSSPLSSHLRPLRSHHLSSSRLC